MIGRATAKKTGTAVGLLLDDCARGVTGAVPKGSVGPNIATTGKPTAAATCIAPESLPRNRWHWDRSAGSSAIVVLPVRSIGGWRNSVTYRGRYCAPRRECRTGLCQRLELTKVGIEGFCETVWRPALGGTVGGPRAYGYAESAPDAHRPQAVDLSQLDALADSRDSQLDVRRRHARRLDPSGATEQFEIVEFFVGWNFAGLRNGDRFGQKEASAIACIADSLRDVCAPGKPSRVEGILQKQCNIEIA